MIKKYSLLTILTVIILVGSSAEHFLAQTIVKLPSIKGKKIGKRGVITSVAKQPKKMPRTTPTPQREPEQSSRWELTGEIKVTGTETYLGGKCTAEMSHIYKSTVILDYMQQSFPSVTDPEELAKISINLPKEIAASVGSSRTMWMVSPLKPPDASSGKLHITIADKRECSILDANRKTWGKSIETLTFDKDMAVGGFGTVTLDKGQRSVWIGVSFEGSGPAEHKIQMPYGEPTIQKGGIPGYPQIEYVTTNTIIPASAAFLQDTNAGFKFTFPDQVGPDAIAMEKKPTVVVTYTFKKL
jgi:hypothetical protein